jgi:membrane fusion protein (multidrug efflux system)
MIKRRTLVTLIVLAAVALAVILIFGPRWRRGGEETGEVSPNMAVHIGKITRATLHRFVAAYGSVEPEPGDKGRPPAGSEVASPVAGIVASIDCVEGQRVAKGTVLFRLDSRVAEVALGLARSALTLAEENFERQKKLLAVDGTSKKSYQEAVQRLSAAQSDVAAATTNLALLRIEAPLGGTVVKINTAPGEAVDLNTVLATVIDLDRLVISASIPGREAAFLEAGQQARFGEPVTTGVLIYVGSRTDPRTGTRPIRISVPAGAGFHPGQFLTAQIVAGEHADVLAAPEVSVISDTVGADTGTIVLVEGDKAVRKPVRIGFREGGLVEVSAEGLREGQVIVTEDAYAVPDGTRIHVVD